MTEPKKKRLEEVNQEISQAKQELNINQSFILSMITQSKSVQSPQKSFNRSQTDPWYGATNENVGCLGGGSSSKAGLKGSASPDRKVKGGVENQDVLNYFANMKKLQSNLQEKSYLLEVDYEKQRLHFENQRAKLAKEIERLKNQSTTKDQRLREMQKQLQDLSHYRRQNIELKNQSKKYKNDNKVLMNHIDRLTKVTQTAQEKKRLMQERQMRVMKSLYQDTLPSIQQREHQKHMETVNSLSNKMALDEAVSTNGELKSLIRRLNEEIQFLKSERQLLLKENKQKTANFQNQKRLADMTEESNQKLKDVITKMGEKIMSLEQMNQTLKESLLKYDQGEETEDQFYFLKQKKVKAGQFYYKNKNK